MGRLPAVTIALLIAALPGCEKDSDAPKAPPPSSRSEAVQVAGPAAAASVAPKPVEHEAAAPRGPRKLCETPPSGAGRALPKEKVDHLDPTRSGEPIVSAKGRWTWVNLWASWCAPCKAEIPRILGWQPKFAAAGAPVTVDFVSLDDDRKQGQTYLTTQSFDGLRASYWLAEGAPRSRFLGEVKVPEGAALPVHLLFDSAGALRCEIDGDVDESDYAQLLALFQKP